MAQLNLHPCAVEMTWFSDEALTGGEWENVLRRFLGELGGNCIAGGGTLIGHIKGIATVAGSPCLQLSLVSLNQPVSIDGSVPDNTDKLSITLNVLVFGMSADDLTATLSVTSDEALASWCGSIDVEILSAAKEYPVAFHG